MKESKNNLECYLRRIINDNQLEHQIDEILKSFDYLHLNKNSLLVKEGQI